MPSLYFKIDHWCNRIKDFIPDFLIFSCVHTYREHNYMADRLAKKALMLDSGNLIVQEYIENAQCQAYTLKLSFSECFPKRTVYNGFVESQNFNVAIVY